MTKMPHCRTAHAAGVYNIKRLDIWGYHKIIRRALHVGNILLTIPRATHSGLLTIFPLRARAGRIALIAPGFRSGMCVKSQSL